MLHASPASKKGPFFASGVLTYGEKGHTLTRDKAYYVCSQRQKGKCDLHTKAIKADTLEKSFSRFAQKFEIVDDLKEQVVFRKILGGILHGLVDDMIEAPLSLSLDYSLDEAKKSLAEENMRQFKQDMKDAKEAMARRLKEADPILVSSLTLGIVMTFGRHDVPLTEMGLMPSYLSKQIILDAKGKIEKVELFAIGDYAFQLIRHYAPTYRIPHHQLNTPQQFESLEFKQVAKQIRRKEIEGMIPHDPFQKPHTLIAAVQYFFTLTTGGVTSVQAIEALKLFSNNPMFGIANFAERVAQPKRRIRKGK